MSIDTSQLVQVMHGTILYCLIIHIKFLLEVENKHAFTFHLHKPLIKAPNPSLDLIELNTHDLCTTL